MLADRLGNIYSNFIQNTCWKVVILMIPIEFGNFFYSKLMYILFVFSVFNRIKFVKFSVHLWVALREMLSCDVSCVLFSVHLWGVRGVMLLCNVGLRWQSTHGSCYAGGANSGSGTGTDSKSNTMQRHSAG